MADTTSTLLVATQCNKKRMVNVSAENFGPHSVTVAKMENQLETLRIGKKEII